MIDQLRRLAIFATTIDHGSFRAAARALRLSPSVVSYQISQLEEELGSALIYRSTRKLSLTPDGERVLTAAHAMIDAAEAGLHAVTDHSREPSGTLRLTAPAVLAQSVLVERLAAYSRAHANVRISLDCSDDRRELIGDGFDIAIRMGRLKDSSLMTRKLFDVGRQLVASESYLKTQRKPSSPSDLRDWDWLELAPVWSERPEFRKKNRRISVTRPPARISVNDAHALFRLTRSGAGLAVVPEFLAAPDIAAGSVRHILPAWTLSSVGVYAVWPSNAPRDGLVKHFVDYLAQAARVPEEETVN